MNTVVNQLVKEAAYHAAKYDSTIQAINALAGSGMDKTAGQSVTDAIVDLFSSAGNYANDVVRNTNVLGQWQGGDPQTFMSNATNNLMPKLQNLGYSLGETDLAQSIGKGLSGVKDLMMRGQTWDNLKGLQSVANFDNSAIGSALNTGAGTISNMINANPELMGLAGITGLGVAGSALAGNSAAQQAASQASQIDALKNQLAAAQSSNGSLLSNLGNRLRNAGSSAMEAIKNNPGTSAAIGAGAAGLAALPFLMGGEKEGSYNPYKLAALRNALANMR